MVPFRHFFHTLAKRTANVGLKKAPSGKTEGISTLISLSKESLLPKTVSLDALALGVTAGSLGTLGGGFLVIPFLLRRLKINQHSANALSLLGVALTGIGGTCAFLKDDEEIVDVPEATIVSTAGLSTVLFGVLFQKKLNTSVLRKIGGCWLLMLSLTVPFKGLVEQAPEDSWLKHTSLQENHTLAEDHAPGEEFSLILSLTGIGAVAGAAKGILGVGGGTFLPPAVGLANHDGRSYKKVMATCLTASIIPAAVGAFAHYRFGNIPLLLILPFSMGAMSGGFLSGTYIAPKLSEDAQRGTFAVLMAILGVKNILLR